MKTLLRIQLLYSFITSRDRSIRKSSKCIVIIFFPQSTINQNSNRSISGGYSSLFILILCSNSGRCSCTTLICRRHKALFHAGPGFRFFLHVEDEQPSLNVQYSTSRLTSAQLASHLQQSHRYRGSNPSLHLLQRAMSLHVSRH